MIELLRNEFLSRFGYPPRIACAPGRINLIGEHTDYQEGFVLPAPINRYVHVAAGTRNDNHICLYSLDYREYFETTLDAIVPTGTWSTYILGVIDQLKHKHPALPGLNIVVIGDVPIGAGLSSSAALECATLTVLNSLMNLRLDGISLARMAQQAEHTFAGVNCGIMDMFVSLFGQPGQALKLDCRSLQFEYYPLAIQEYKLVLFNTNIKHSLAASEYNTRRAQCEEGVRWVQETYPAVRNLRDVTTAILDTCMLSRDQALYRRCNYVVQENQRVALACAAMSGGNMKALGRLLFETHAGLRDDYEVSCRELDVIVDIVQALPSVAGARMMGGGFGGCVIALIERASLDNVIDTVARAYKKKIGLDMTPYAVETGRGSHLIS